MKKRLLSLALALVMVFSLLPINAFAIGDTTILSQPTSVTVQAGGTAEFSVSAVNTAHPTATLYYIWYDTFFPSRSVFDSLLLINQFDNATHS